MPAPISVVIPTLNSEPYLSDTLQSLMEGVDAGLIAELIVTDGGSDDGTCVLADAWGAHIVTGPASRGGQLRRGCAVARAEWLLVVHSDTRFEQGWSETVHAHLTRARAAWFQLRFDQGGRVVAAWANMRARLFGLPYGDQALLVPRHLYVELGGYQDIPLMEDVAMARALRGRLTGLDASVVTSSKRYRAQGWLRRGARNLWLLAQYYAGADPIRLAARYRR